MRNNVDYMFKYSQTWKFPEQVKSCMVSMYNPNSNEVGILAKGEDVLSFWCGCEERYNRTVYITPGPGPKEKTLTSQFYHNCP